ncbi:hypothetical protein V4V36_11265 [Paenibacillus lautus]|jgi:hypothetical protein|uniref:hypothetical protein n=1 Tax=Paenibacillus lautus TaxID=1401 RepID=UPI0010DA6856|nr:hypothetical protein [Paenibacillus lautus]MBY0164110.1 hypothetical protein [Cytobacillus firmus]MCI1776966.1 hypothetical protein [Paenibacillus lautus]VTR40134.1 Uncharacterised protein [Actinobacillus pleuropneumoniae]
MNNWFVVESLIKQQQVELDREAGESWKYTHDRVRLLARFFPAKRRQFQPVKKRARNLN